MDMKCPHCGADIAPDSKFCEQCGTPIQRPVPVGAHKTAVERNKMILIGAVAFVIFGVGGGMFLHSTVTKPQTDTPQQAVPASQERPQENVTPEPIRIPKDTHQDQLASANSILQDKGIPYSLQAVSTIDGEGFMGVSISEKTTFIIYDATDGVVATVPWNPLLLNPGANSNSTNKALQFNVSVLHDDRSSKDAGAGYWQGSTHIIPIQAYTKVENGKLIPLGIFTHQGRQAAPFKEYLYEQQNVNLVNTLLTHADSLRDDMAKRNITY